jgi:hypothetical protein
MQATGTGYPITSSPDISSSIPAEPTIPGGAFWPDIDPATFRSAMRLDGTITPQRLRAELTDAILTTQHLLGEWAARQQQDPALQTPFDPSAPLATVIDGKTAAHHRYLRAVWCFAAASLQERYRAFDNTEKADRRADALDPVITQLQRDAHRAIADMQGTTRCTVELI